MQKIQSSEQNVDPYELNPSWKLSGICLGPKAATELLFVAAGELDKMESVTVCICTSLLCLLVGNVLKFLAGLLLAREVKCTSRL